ncbi:MACPF domain-containing protein [Bacteroides sp. BFG-257]|uniref:MAC/perforin domain-containing protein n=1 Tax=Bacteroides TaxID=816 RepID=UPI001CD00CBE|nr:MULTISPECIES: MAC/perforin domain-containing protein [Bacteroides]UBD70596.1 hypothetical protein K6V21_03990 [Bacteroides cellulosilyticus]UVO99223.1 MACPF domain-containing protein [Bacteroides sp. BFG-257]
MKKSYYLLGFLPLFYSCSEIEDLPKVESLVSNVTTRAAGDGVYDVLGYGYDITDEYMGENSTRLKILDVEAFVKANPNRFDKQFSGVIDQRCFAGANAQSFLSQIITDTNFSGSVGSLPEKKDKEGFFSGTITTGFKTSSKYSYSSKYSFARAEVFKKQRRYLLNTDIETLSKYLLSSFIEDLNKYSADRIVEMYGTHVLTNIIVGGKYTAYYKSAIIEENSSTEKTEIVSAGAKYNLSNIGLDAHGSWSKTEVEERNKKNSNWECYIKALGGSTSGTTITLVPEQGPTFTINLGAWTESVDDQHSRLFDVNWNATYPIYDLISDPVKKQQIKEAVFRYIDSKKIEILPIVPVYQSWNGKDHYYNTNYSPTYGAKNDWKYEYVAFCIFSKPVQGTVPFYQYWNGKDHYYTVGYHPGGYQGYNFEGVLGYVYDRPTDGALPLYQAWNGRDHYYNTNYSPTYGEGEWKCEYIECYVPN